MLKIMSTSQGPWDIFPEGTGQGASLVLVSYTGLNGTPGNKLEGGRSHWLQGWKK